MTSFLKDCRDIAVLDYIHSHYKNVFLYDLVGFAKSFEEIKKMYEKDKLKLDKICFSYHYAPAVHVYFKLA